MGSNVGMIRWHPGSPDDSGTIYGDVTDASDSVFSPCHFGKKDPSAAGALRCCDSLSFTKP